MIPSPVSMREVATNFKPEQKRFLEEYITTIGYEIKDCAQKGQFELIISVPKVMFMKPDINLELTILEVCNSFRSTGYTVRRVAQNKIYICWALPGSMFKSKLLITETNIQK
jgi:hypothetical protein